MTSHTGPIKHKAPLVVDWIYVSYRPVMLVGALLVAGAVGVWGWSVSHGPVTEERAQRAVAAAEQMLTQAAGVEPGAPALPEARAQLQRAKDELARGELPPAYTDATAAERAARQILEARRAEGDSDVRVVRVEGDVRIKRAGQFLWESASDRDQLRAGDQLRTGAGGLAQLVYFDGTMMTVDPGTLLEIRELRRDHARRTQRVSERLAWGQLSAQTQDTEGYESVHEVATDSASVRARRAAEFQVRYDQDKKESEVVATRGALSLDTDGREQPLPESTRVTVDQGRIVERTQLLDPPRLMGPADQKIFLAPSEAAVALNWTAVERAKGYWVQVSERPLFSASVIEDRKVQGEALELQSLGAGTYYWRVCALDQGQRGGRWSESRKFRVLSAEFKDPDDKTPPPLDISEVMVVGMQAIVTGRAEPGALLWVEGERVDVDDDGRFTWVVKLKQDGENKIRFVAQDAAGNETRKVAAAYVDGF